eukprot:5245406-Ditylum_brightwellii.AAC.1
MVSLILYSSVVSDMSDEVCAKTHLSDGEMKALVNKQCDGQLIKAKNHPLANYAKKPVMPNK